MCCVHFSSRYWGATLSSLVEFWILPHFRETQWPLWTQSGLSCFVSPCQYLCYGLDCERIWSWRPLGDSWKNHICSWALFRRLSFESIRQLQVEFPILCCIFCCRLFYQQKFCCFCYYNNNTFRLSVPGFYFCFKLHMKSINGINTVAIALRFLVLSSAEVSPVPSFPVRVYSYWCSGSGCLLHIPAVFVRVLCNLLSWQ